MAKIIKFSTEARTKMLNGVNILANAVRTISINIAIH
jgi:chaperonin GroEL (HSP60 family)